MTREELEAEIKNCDDILFDIGTADFFTSSEREAYEKFSKKRRILLSQWFSLTGETKYNPKG